MPEVAIGNGATQRPMLLPMEMWLWSGLAVVLLVGLVVPLWWSVRLDGLGHRPPPASHPAWSEQSEPLT